MPETPIVLLQEISIELLEILFIEKNQGNLNYNIHSLRGCLRKNNDVTLIENTILYALQQNFIKNENGWLSITDLGEKILFS